MNKNIIKTILYSLILAYASSCTEKLDIEVAGDESKTLVVYGSITTDTTSHMVTLSRTVSVNDTSITYESNAHLTITDGSKIIELTETGPGVYITAPDVYGEVGKTYTLNITLEDGEEYTASSRLNPVSTIDSVVLKKVDVNLAGLNYIIYFNGLEPAGKGNYYIWNLYLNDTLYNSLDETTFESDDFVDGQYVYDFDIYWIDEEDFVWDTVKYTVEMLSITEEYYNYLYEVMSETAWRGGPFDATPANVSTNISGDAQGFFYAAAVTRKDSVFIESEAETVAY